MNVIELMRTFVTVAKTGSFTAAAERLGISRALTSKYVAQLEERLGLRLLNRTTRSVDVTEIGRAYIKRCLPLLEDFDDLELAVRNQSSVPRGRIRISAPMTFGELFLPQILSEFTDRYPEISVNLSLSDRYVNLVEEGFDIAIRIGKLSDSSLIAKKLISTRFVVCAAPDYIEYHGAPSHPSDLKSHQCVLDDNFRYGDHWPFAISGKTETIAVSGRIWVNSARAVREFVLTGKGIGLCASFLISDDIRSERLRYLLADFETPEFGVHAVYPHNRHLAIKERALIDFLVERLPAICN